MLLHLSFLLQVVSSAPTAQAPPPAPGDSLHWLRTSRAGVTILYTEADSGTIAGLVPMIEAGRTRIVTWFGAPFAEPFEVRVFPGRASLTDYWRRAWKLPDLRTECWMVASGVAGELDLLSPRVWRSEACEHDPADGGHMGRVITHELVHVYHAQHNPHPDFDGMDDLGWFVEGIAVVVSGQLEAEHQGRAARAIAEGRSPVQLAQAWTGPYRYGVAGSIADWVDRTWGRATTNRLLTMTTLPQILDALGVSEADLLARWRAAVAR